MRVHSSPLLLPALFPMLSPMQAALSDLAAKPAAKDAADPTSALVAVLVLAGMATVAFLLFRRVRQARQEQFGEPDRKGDAAERDKGARKRRQEEDDDDVSDEARAAARALRKAAKGAIKVGADGKLSRLSVDPAADRAAAQRLAAARPAPVTSLEPEAPKVAPAVRDEALRAGLQRTRQEGFIARLGKLFGGKALDESLLGSVEEVLYTADIGVKATEKLLGALREGLSRKELGDEEKVWETLRKQARRILEGAGSAELPPWSAGSPLVIMVIGVNGTGKTTTIGKLAHRFVGQGKRVLVAAADTFRAAAVDQLAIWCERAGAELHRGKTEADPASVAFDALQRGQREGYDLVIVDTAGRLHTNTNLVEELKKVRRVVSKAQADAPHEVLLVLDATMGQNAVQQATIFKDALQVTGIVLTKIDGTARGGVVLSVADTLGLPVKLVGVGEKMTDLKPFDAEAFVSELFESTPSSPSAEG